jgi:integrase/ferredoxin
MTAEPRAPAAHRQRLLAERLTGMWGEDVWTFPLDKPPKGHRCFVRFRFTCREASLNTELKVALKDKHERGVWRAKHRTWARYFHTLVDWLKTAAPGCRSLLEWDEEAWETSLRAYLEEQHLYQPHAKSWLNAAQELVPSRDEDPRIALLRHIYRCVADAYDGRAEWEKDRWDLRALGMDVDPTKSARTLSFTAIAQPWLRDLAKRFLRYNASIHTASDCLHKLTTLNHFSAFLAARHPTARVADIDRALIVDFLGHLPAALPSVNHRASTITRLRTILETLAHQLQAPGLTKERVIFDEDVPKRVKPAPRDLPDGVLAQLHQHFATLPAPIRCMTLIMLECMLRVGEVCALARDCLFQDGQGHWYLRLYQRKLKQEHTIPLVDLAVVEAIQRQQEEVRARYGDAHPWLFPNPYRPEGPFQAGRYAARLNEWAAAHEIVGPTGALWRFQAHQFRHTGAQRLLDRGVSLPAISRLLGHHGLDMTEVYARKRAATIRAELERTIRTRVTVDADGRVVRGDPRAEDPDLQALRQDLRGAVLPIGTCGRLRVLGACEHEHACATCRFWRTSTEDLPRLDEWVRRQERLLPLARQQGNERLAAGLERLLPGLRQRVATLREHSAQEALPTAERLSRYRAELVTAEAGLAEARTAGLWLAVKTAEQHIAELHGRIAAVEMEERQHGGE